MQLLNAAEEAFEEAKRNDKRMELAGSGSSGAEVLKIIVSFHLWLEKLKQLGISK